MNADETDAAREKIEDARERLLILLEEIQAESRLFREILQNNPNDAFGIRMRTHSLQGKLPQAIWLSVRMDTLMNLKYRLDGSMVNHEIPESES